MIVVEEELTVWVRMGTMAQTRCPDVVGQRRDRGWTGGGQNYTGRVSLVG